MGMQQNRIRKEFKKQTCTEQSCLKVQFFAHDLIKTYGISETALRHRIDRYTQKGIIQKRTIGKRLRYFTQEEIKILTAKPKTGRHDLGKPKKPKKQKIRFWKISVFSLDWFNYMVKAVCLTQAEAEEIKKELILCGIDAKSSPHIMINPVGRPRQNEQL